MVLLAVACEAATSRRSWLLARSNSNWRASAEARAMLASLTCTQQQQTVTNSQRGQASTHSGHTRQGACARIQLRINKLVCCCTACPSPEAPAGPCPTGQDCMMPLTTTAPAHTPQCAGQTPQHVAPSPRTPVSPAAAHISSPQAHTAPQPPGTRAPPCAGQTAQHAAP